MNKGNMKDSAAYHNQVTGGGLSRPALRKKLRRWLGDHKWLLVGVLGVVAGALGYVGFSRYFLAIGEPRSSGNILYLSLQLFVLESGSVPGPVTWELQVARFLAPAVTAYTAIQALATVFREQFQMFRLRFFRDHVVICGLGRSGLLLAKGFCEKGERVVVIEQNGDNSMLRPCREYGAIILIGNATDPALLRSARVNKAKYIISVCGDDGTNAEVAVHARELVRGRKGKALTCLAHIYDLQFCNLLREQEIAMAKPDEFRLELFNIFESGARVLLDEYPPFDEAAGVIRSKPHIVVVGVGRMGESLVVNAARNWSDRSDTKGERPRITLIDKEVERRKESLCLRYPQLERTCELVCRQMDVRFPEFERADFLFDDGGHCDVTKIYVCLDNDSLGLDAALTLRQRVRSLEIPIVVRMTHNAGLATLLPEEDEHKGLATVHAFGLLDRTCTPDLILRGTYEILAHAIHEEYVRHEREKGHTPETNLSMVPWDELPESLKESNRSQAEGIRVKLEAIGCDIAITTGWSAQLVEFSPEEVELMAKIEHDRWVKDRLAAGWRYGRIRDPERKTSPYLVPWIQLLEEVRDIDRNAVRAIPALLAKVRFQVYRVGEKQ
jgi:hypothetical protein